MQAFSFQAHVYRHMQELQICVEALSASFEVVLKACSAQLSQLYCVAQVCVCVCDLQNVTHMLLNGTVAGTTAAVAAFLVLPSLAGDAVLEGTATALRQIGQTMSE